MQEQSSEDIRHPDKNSLYAASRLLQHLSHQPSKFPDPLDKAIIHTMAYALGKAADQLESQRPKIIPDQPFYVEEILHASALPKINFLTGGIGLSIETPKSEKSPRHTLSSQQMELVLQTLGFLAPNESLVEHIATNFSKSDLTDADKQSHIIQKLTDRLRGEFSETRIVTGDRPNSKEKIELKKQWIFLKSNYVPGLYIELNLDEQGNHERNPLIRLGNIFMDKDNAILGSKKPDHLYESEEKITVPGRRSIQVGDSLTTR